MSNTPTPRTKSPVNFVSWQPEDAEPPRKSAPRAYHRKSRTGCQQCRARRVKCDETHSICKNCERHKSSCTWDHTSDHDILVAPVISNSTASIVKNGPLSSSDPFSSSAQHSEIPETKDRRRSELFLLHHWMTTTSLTFNLPDSKSSTWGTMIPPLAFKHDSLLYAIYAVTSLHLSHLHPNEKNHFKTYQEYFGRCLRLHRDSVINLNASNADAAMLTATLLRVCSIAVLQLRDLEDEQGTYVPPVEWLIMNFGTGHGLSVAAWKHLMHDEKSIMRALISDDTPGLDPSSRTLRDDRIFARSNITPALSKFLYRTTEQEIEEPWDEEIQSSYEDAVAYLGACQQAVEAGEPEPRILRWVALFPAIIERRFISLVEERKERALVILAYYFSFWRRFQNIWWCGLVGWREMSAISRVLDDQWRVLLSGLAGSELFMDGLRIDDAEQDMMQ